MEQFNYHKLVNLRKRFAGYDCPASREMLLVIDKHIAIQKVISAELKQKRQDEYMFEDLDCPICGKTYKRSYMYKHKQSHA